MNKEYVNWNDVEEFINSLNNFYKNKDIPGVYGLPRGGLVLAVMLSHKMNIPLLMAPVENCIIIDDICDSGESLLHYYKDSSGTNMNKYHITTMFYKDNKLVQPECFRKRKEDKWIIFPWEVE